MSKIYLNIWGRAFSLDVVYQNFPDENITALQKQTLETLPATDYNQAISGLKQYITLNSIDNRAENNLDNVFRYVIPRKILITRNEKDRVFALLCDFKYDIEHGIAIVFENERYKGIGPEDIIL